MFCFSLQFLYWNETPHVCFLSSFFPKFLRGKIVPLAVFLKGQFQLQCRIGTMAWPGSNPALEDVNFFAILITNTEILPKCHLNCSCRVTYVAVSFFPHSIGCVYLFSATYMTKLSFPWSPCTGNSEALLLVSVIGFAVKGPSVSRISSCLKQRSLTHDGI